MPRYQPIIPGLSVQEWAAPFTAFGESRRARDVQALALREQERREAALKAQEERARQSHEIAVRAEERKRQSDEFDMAEKVKARDAATNKEIYGNLDVRGKNQPSLGKQQAQAAGYSVEQVEPTPIVPEQITVPTRENDPALRGALTPGSVEMQPGVVRQRMPSEEEFDVAQGPSDPRGQRPKLPLHFPPLPPAPDEFIGRYVKGKQGPVRSPNPEFDAYVKAGGGGEAYPGGPRIAGPVPQDIYGAARAEQKGAFDALAPISADYEQRRKKLAADFGIAGPPQTPALQAEATRRNTQAVADADAQNAEAKRQSILQPEFRLTRPGAPLAPQDGESATDFTARQAANVETWDVRPGESEAGRQAILAETAARFRAMASQENDPYIKTEIKTTANLVGAGQLTPRQAEERLAELRQTRMKGVRAAESAQESMRRALVLARSKPTPPGALNSERNTDLNVFHKWIGNSNYKQMLESFKGLDRTADNVKQAGTNSAQAIKVAVGFANAAQERGILTNRDFQLFWSSMGGLSDQAKQWLAGKYDGTLTDERKAEVGAAMAEWYTQRREEAREQLAAFDDSFNHLGDYSSLRRAYWPSWLTGRANAGVTPRESVETRGKGGKKKTGGPLPGSAPPVGDDDAVRMSKSK